MTNKEQKMLPENLVKGEKYNVNGTVMAYCWHRYSPQTKTDWYFFSSGYFTHTLTENELVKFVEKV
jgi:hypothetical protein